MEWIKKYWSIITSIIFIVFYIGYIMAQLNNKVDNNKVDEIVRKAFQEYKTDSKDSYIKIDQVPGLQERLQNIEEGLKENKTLTQKIYDKILGGEIKK